MKQNGISPKIFEFLKVLELNNHRDWFQEHKAEYERARVEAVGFFQQVFDSLKQHDHVNEMKVFRIYRDVRFSKDKQPYQTHFAAAFHREKPRYRGGYYLHLRPGQSFVGCGFWGPSSEDLLRIRQEIDTDAEGLIKAVSTTDFKQQFGALQGDQLKTVPRGFDKAHPAADLLRFKQFLAVRNFTDEQVLHPQFPEELDVCFRAVKPFFDYMTDALTTDANGVSLFD